MEVVYLLFRKAFDLSRLLNEKARSRLGGCQMGRKLANRQHSEGSSYSDLQPITNAAPQKSILGLLVFNMSINFEMIEQKTPSPALLATLNWVMIWTSLKGVPWLQRDLDGLEEWTSKHCMRLNEDKSLHMKARFQVAGSSYMNLEVLEDNKLDPIGQDARFSSNLHFPFTCCFEVPSNLFCGSLSIG